MTAGTAGTAGAGWAIVTGASGDLGREIARLLAERGYSLILAARRVTLLEELRDELVETYGVAVAAVPLDLTDTDNLVTNLQDALRSHDITETDIQLLVNNAGNGYFGYFHNEDPAALSRGIRLNIDAPAQLIRWIIPIMRRRGGGTICNVASVAAFSPGPLMASYYAAKGWMLSLGESLHEELKGDGIAVVTCCPGPFRSAFHRAAGIDPDSIGTVPSAGVVAGAVVAAIERPRPVVPIGAVPRIWAVLSPRLPRSWSRRIVATLQSRRRS